MDHTQIVSCIDTAIEICQKIIPAHNYIIYRQFSLENAKSILNAIGYSKKDYASTPRILQDKQLFSFFMKSKEFEKSHQLRHFTSQLSRAIKLWKPESSHELLLEGYRFEQSEESSLIYACGSFMNQCRQKHICNGWDSLFAARNSDGKLPDNTPIIILEADKINGNLSSPSPIFLDFILATYKYTVLNDTKDYRNLNVLIDRVIACQSKTDLYSRLPDACRCCGEYFTNFFVGKIKEFDFKKQSNEKLSYQKSSFLSIRKQDGRKSYPKRRESTSDHIGPMSESNTSMTRASKRVSLS